MRKSYKYFGGIVTNLLLCLALGILVSSCKQKINEEQQNEITITVKSDDGFVISSANSFKFKKNSTWKEIGPSTKSYVKQKEGKKIKEWRT